MNEIYHALVLNLHRRRATWTAVGQPTIGKSRRSSSRSTGFRGLFGPTRMLPGCICRCPARCWRPLSHPEFQRKVYGAVDCGSVLWALQKQRIFEILGTGYYHPVLALIPEADWDEQIARWQAIARHVFWRSHFPGFWPPEIGFDMSLIPHLKKAGYRYVMVNSEYVDRSTR